MLQAGTGSLHHFMRLNRFQPSWNPLSPPRGVASGATVAAVDSQRCRDLPEVLRRQWTWTAVTPYSKGIILRQASPGKEDAMS